MRTITKAQALRLNEIFQSSQMQFSLMFDESTQAHCEVKCRDYMSDALFVSAGLITEARIYGFLFTPTRKVRLDLLLVSNTTDAIAKRASKAIQEIAPNTIEKVELNECHAFLFKFSKDVFTSTFAVSLITHLIRCASLVTGGNITSLLQANSTTDGKYNTVINEAGGTEFVKNVMDHSEDLWKLQTEKIPGISALHDQSGIYSLAIKNTPWEKINEYSWRT